jgi:hypothetical protein
MPKYVPRLEGIMHDPEGTYEYDFPIFILSIHFRQISVFLNHQRHSEYKITKDIQSNNNNNIVLSMLYAEICPFRVVHYAF